MIEEALTKQRGLVLAKTPQSPFLRTKTTHSPFLNLVKGLLFALMSFTVGEDAFNKINLCLLHGGVQLVGNGAFSSFSQQKGLDKKL